MILKSPHLWWGIRYFILMATDGLHWRMYAPDWLQTSVEFGLGENYQLREIRKFDLSPETFSEFPFLLDELIFVSTAKPATLDRIQLDFGDTSNTFINSITLLKNKTQNMESIPDIAVAYDQWKRFLSIAYGSFDDSPTMFLVHTYLSVFSKLVAYSVLAGPPEDDTNTIKSILNGEIFERLNVERFVEDDFFHWVSSEAFYTGLRPLFSEITRTISKYDFGNVKEDILKGVYQELIDLDTRHALGEYYTPDWLCEMIVDNLNGVTTENGKNRTLRSFWGGYINHVSTYAWQMPAPSGREWELKLQGS